MNTQKQSEIWVRDCGRFLHINCAIGDICQAYAKKDISYISAQKGNGDDTSTGLVIGINEHNVFHEGSNEAVYEAYYAIMDIFANEKDADVVDLVYDDD